MSKILTLAFCLLSLSSLINAKKECVVELVSPAPPPTCYEENGQQWCEAIGPALALFILTPNETYGEANFPIAEINFSGTCACDFTLYTRSNLKGSWYRAWFSKRSSRRYVVSDIWSKQANSVKATCTF